MSCVGVRAWRTNRLATVAGVDSSATVYATASSSTTQRSAEEASATAMPVAEAASMANPAVSTRWRGKRSPAAVTTGANTAVGTSWMTTARPAAPAPPWSKATTSTVIHAVTSATENTNPTASRPRTTRDVGRVFSLGVVMGVGTHCCGGVCADGRRETPRRSWCGRRCHHDDARGPLTSCAPMSADRKRS